MPSVTQAWRMAVALHMDDLSTVLDIYPTLYHHGRALLAPRLPLIQERALRLLCVAYLPSLPVSFLSRRLGFGVDVHGCVQYLRSMGVDPAQSSVTGRKEPELETRSALRTLDQMAAERREREQQEEQRQKRLQQGNHPTNQHARSFLIGPPIPKYEEWNFSVSDW